MHLMWGRTSAGPWLDKIQSQAGKTPLPRRLWCGIKGRGLLAMWRRSEADCCWGRAELSEITPLSCSSWTFTTMDLTEDMILCWAASSPGRPSVSGAFFPPHPCQVRDAYFVLVVSSSCLHLLKLIFLSEMPGCSPRAPVVFFFLSSFSDG